MLIHVALNCLHNLQHLVLGFHHAEARTKTKAKGGGEGKVDFPPATPKAKPKASPKPKSSPAPPPDTITQPKKRARKNAANDDGLPILSSQEQEQYKNQWKKFLVFWMCLIHW